MFAIGDLGVLADDLSGACNVASCFARRTGGVRVRVHHDLPAEAGAALQVLNTQSRSLAAGDCRASTCRAGRQLRDKSHIFMKIDTALRGSVGAQIEGAIEAVGEREVFVAPAIPGIGRITAGGTQYDRGVPIGETAYAADPVSPIVSSRVLDIIEATGSVNVRVCDASTDSDLDDVVDRALASTEALLVGSLGLADALARKLPVSGSLEVPPGACRTTGPVLVICGSKYRRALDQIDRAAKELCVPLLALDAYGSWTTNGRLHGGRAVICSIGDAAAWPEDRRPEAILQEFVSRLAPILETTVPRGVGVVGGDTAFALMMRCGVTALEIEGSVGGVVACGRILDGSLAGSSFAVKGGSVGDPDAVLDMVACLEREGVGNG
jgi:uncharacterized protein YgbK (DUF1537 family)